MDIKKRVQLTTGPFEKLIRNGESVDFRLDEPVWKNVLEGDHIEFWEDISGWDKEPSPLARKVVVKIVEIFRAASFSELIDTFPGSFSRDEAKEDTIENLRQWWTPHREKETGVIGWRVQLFNPE